MRKILVSNSFTPDQARLLVFIIQQILRGGDLTVAARHRACPGLIAKIGRMRDRLEKLKAKRQGEEDESRTSTADIKAAGESNR